MPSAAATDAILLADNHLLYRMNGDQVAAVGCIAQTVDNLMQGFLLPGNQYALDTRAAWGTDNKAALALLDWKAAPLDTADILSAEPE